MGALTTPERLYNSPLEAGLRVLFLLYASGASTLDAQRLLYFDYLCLHSADAGGPPSLHPQAPLQVGEVLVRREVLADGLALVVSRELVQRKFMASGIRYRLTKAGAHVLTHFESGYALDLRERAKWVIDSFGKMSDVALAAFMSDHVSNWQNELVREVSVAGNGEPDE